MYTDKYEIEFLEDFPCWVTRYGKTTQYIAYHKTDERAIYFNKPLIVSASDIPYLLHFGNGFRSMKRVFICSMPNS